MKRILSLLAVVSLLFALGCNRAESWIVGQWKIAEVPGFVAEFKKDHTGSTSTPTPGHAGTPNGPATKVAFKWSLEKDKRIKISEDKTVYYGKLVGKKLEIDISGHKSVLEKITK
jgi:hypothetical protein